jgi:hypothetical protein
VGSLTVAASQSQPRYANPSNQVPKRPMRIHIDCTRFVSGRRSKCVRENHSLARIGGVRHIRTSPEGAADNSPALQHWVKAKQRPSPGGTTEVLTHTLHAAPSPVPQMRRRPSGATATAAGCPTLVAFFATRVGSLTVAASQSRPRYANPSNQVPKPPIQIHIDCIRFVSGRGFKPRHHP